MKDKSRNELIKELKEIVSITSNNTLSDHLEAADEQIDNIQMSVTVKDTSKTGWKGKHKFVKSFDIELKKLITSKKLTYEEYGFFSVLSLYLDYEDNYIMLNDETYLTQKDMIKLTEFSRRKISQMLNKFISLDLIIEEKQIKDKRLKRYYINPNYFFRGKMIDRDRKEQFK